MKILKFSLLMISLSFAIAMPAYSVDISNATSKTRSAPGPLSIKKKIYQVPGSVAISYAKQQGYLFDAKNETKNFAFDKGACVFMGAHWTAKSKRSCFINGFIPPKAKNKARKCRELRKDWTVKDMKLKGNYVWASRPVNTNKPYFSARVNNQSTATQVISIDWVKLEGPEGPANHWQEAFSHCAEN